MKKESLVKLLTTDVSRWNSERPRFADLGGVDLSGAQLMGADLKNVIFNGTNLSGANLSGAEFLNNNLWGASLIDTTLRGAKLIGGDCVGTQLNRADLRDAKLYFVNFNHANLTDAKFQGAKLNEVNFLGVNLSSTIGLEACDHHGHSSVDHRTVEISGMLPDSFLRGCGLPDTLIEFYPSLLNRPFSFYSCFISYSHVDKVFARRLHDQLQGRGIRCWLDEHQLLPGDDIFERVDQGIKLWDKVLLCASKSSLTSWWVDNEINSAFKKEQSLMRERQKKVWSLIPLNLDGFLFSGNWGQGKADQVKSRLAADFTGWEKNNEKFEIAFESLIKALQTENAGRETPPGTKL